MTALVFDRLSPEARRLAVQAAQSYLGTQTETPGYVGIFGVDLALTPYAPFTRNARVLRQALDKMASRGSASLQQCRTAAAEGATRISRRRRAAASGQRDRAAAAGGGGSVGTAAGRRAAGADGVEDDPTTST